MFKTIIKPRIGETNALRHITSSTIPTWFETASNDIFEIFNPTHELTYKKWNLKTVHMDLNIIKDAYFGYDIEIRTHIIKIGKTSITLYHEAWQNGKIRSNGKVIMLYYDYIHLESKVIPEDIRNRLKEHLISMEEIEEKNKNEIRKNSSIQKIDFIESS
jgi:acyl-CoA thioester hydrolase